MITLEPVTPGYIIHISNEEEWAEIMEYVSSNGCKPIGSTSGGYRWVRIRYENNRVYCTKGDRSTYMSSAYRQYTFLEFSEIPSDSVYDHPDFFLTAFDLMGGD